MSEILVKLFKTIDNKDAEGFCSFLTEDAVFAYGSQAPVAGRESIRDYVAGFFSTLEGLEHAIEESWQVDATAFVRGEVTYRLPGGKRLSLPFLNLLRLRGDRFSEYRVFIDPTPLSG